MKYIEKNPEPEPLKQWREKQLETGVNFTYENFCNPEKSITKQSLLDEQGFICCYCCQRINDRTSHYELKLWEPNHPLAQGKLFFDADDCSKAIVKVMWKKLQNEA